MDHATLDSITDIAAHRWKTRSTDPRTAQLMESLVRHLHAFARENELTLGEWFEATEWMSRTGRISDAKRKEFILASDVLGLSMLLELMHDGKPGGATQNSLLGPFYIEDSPLIGYGERLPGIADGDGEPLIVSGTVSDLAGNPLAGALIDVWQNDAEGTYEAQLERCEAPYHRAKIRTRDDGSYMFRTVVPVDYSIPTDGPVGQLIGRTTISDVRPAHIHFKVEADGHAPLVTHVFDGRSKSLATDPVFGTRDGLLLDFAECPAGTAPNGDAIDRPFRAVALDFRLA
ncbi:dioxygenase family protein [Tsuneonella sp. HG222]